MAGDWIKVEVATLDKPEVISMAEMLGVKRDEMIGIMFRFWAWLDRSTSNGVVTPMSRFGIDEVMHTPGFGAALESVGWCKFDEKARTFSVPNADRHNFSTAKSRALGKDRKREFDERKSNADTVTIEKNRRVIKRERLEAPTSEHVELAASLRINCDTEWAKYLDHQRNAKNKHTDLEAGFRNWLKRADEFRPRSIKPSPLHDKRAATAAAMLGPKESHEPNDITAEVIRVA